MNDYNENKVEVILVEGSVGVGSEYVSEIKIAPNQMAVIDNVTNHCEVVEIVSSNYIGWIDGYFRYVNVEFYKLMRDLSLWYNIDIEYDENNFINKEISLSISRDLPLKKIINVIEDILDVKFINEGGNKYVIEK